MSSTYSLDCCVLQSEGQHTHQDFVHFELLLLSTLHFRLQVDSPYDLLRESSQKLGLSSKEEVLVEATMDYMLSLG